MLPWLGLARLTERRCEPIICIGRRKWKQSSSVSRELHKRMHGVMEEVEEEEVDEWHERQSRDLISW